MFGLNIEQLAKDELAKEETKLKAIDADHDGISDIAEAEKAASEAVAELKILEAKVTPDDIDKALNVLFPGKFTEADILAGEDAINKIEDAAAHVEGVAKAAGITL